MTRKVCFYCGLNAIIPLTVFMLTGCGSPNVTTDFAPCKYQLTCTNKPHNPKAAYVALKETILDSKPISLKSVRFQEIQAGTKELVILLNESGLFSSVVNYDPIAASSQAKGFMIEVSLIEKENVHAGRAFSGGFASGFLTLGIAPVNFPYTYSSDMKLKLTTPVGRTIEKTFSKQAQVSATHYVGEAKPERVLARKYVTSENNKALVAYIVEISHELYN